MKLQADLHTHTIASTHAYSTITENCEWAEKYGLKACCIAGGGLYKGIGAFLGMDIIDRNNNNSSVVNGYLDKYISNSSVKSNSK